MRDPTDKMDTTFYEDDYDIRSWMPGKWFNTRKLLHIEDNH